MAIGTPTLLTSGNTANSYFTTFTTASFAVTAGDVIVLQVGGYINSTTAASLQVNSQTHTGTWTWTAVRQSAVGASDGATGAIFVATAPASSSGTVTVGYTGGATVGYYRWAVVNCTGVSLPARQSGSSAITASVTLAALAASSLVLGFGYDAYSSTLALGSGWTNIHTSALNGVEFINQYDFTSPSNIFNFTGAASGNAAVFIVVELPDAAGGAATSLVPVASPTPAVMHLLVR